MDFQVFEVWIFWELEYLEIWFSVLIRRLTVIMV